MQFHIYEFNFWRKVIFLKLFPYLKRILGFDFFLRLIFKGISMIKLELISFLFRIFFFNTKLFFFWIVLIDIFINLIKENVYSKGCYLDKKESQDMRIRKPKLQKGNERKLKRKEKKQNKEMRFHRKYWVISTRGVSPKSPRGPAASAFFFLFWRWAVGGVRHFGSSNRLILIWYIP